MSAQQIIECMKKLGQVHTTFNQLAEEKTEALKKGDISHLRSLLQKESAYLKQLQQLEQERVRLVRFFITGKGLASEGGTITELLLHVTEEEKNQLISLQKELIEEIEKLKMQNELNQQLIQDSLRFVNLSLDVIQPQSDTGNYQRTTNDDDEQLGRSLFDTKA
jgi:flagellar biosynthesis/type III secretory pathway chaperone